MLIVTYKEAVGEYLPLHLRCGYNRLIFAFLPRSKAYKLFFTKVSVRYFVTFIAVVDDVVHREKLLIFGLVNYRLLCSGAASVEG